MKRKFMSLFLAILLCTSAVFLLASCDVVIEDIVITGATTTQNEHICPAPPVIDDNFAHKGYSGDDLIVKVAYVEGNTGEYTRRSLKADEMDQSDVDIATMTRNARLKKQLGLELYIELYTPSNTSVGGFDNFYIDNLIDDVCSDSSQWDIIVSTPTHAATLTKTGYLLNLSDPEAWNADYLDLNAPYWNHAYNEAMSYKGAYYWITGNIALRYTGGMYCTYVNQKLYDDHLSAEYGSVYDIAKNGSWTIDLMTQMATMSYDHLNEGESFGFIYEKSEMINAFAMGMDATFASIDSTTGDVLLAVMTKHTFDISQKIADLTENSFSNQQPYDYTNLAIQSFAHGNALFTVNTMLMADQYLKDMADGYYVIPLPKFDSNQKQYKTAINDSVSIFGIPLSSKRIPQAAAALEFLCAYSSKDVAPLFYESVLKGKYTRDPDAAEVIDIIADSVDGDFIAIWNSNIDNIDDIFQESTSMTPNSVKRHITYWDNYLHDFTNMLEDAREFLEFKKEALKLQ